MNTFTFTTTLWIWNNNDTPASQRFLTVPNDISDNIKHLISTQPKK